MYRKINWELLWQLLRIYGVGGKSLNGIKIMYINSLSCVRVKRGENESLKINSGVINLFVMKLGIKKKGNGYQEFGLRVPKEMKEWKFLGLLIMNDTVHNEMEENFKVVIRNLAQVSKRRI